MKPAVGECVVHGHLIRKRDHPQVSEVQLWNLRPEPVSIAFLRLAANGISDDIRAPLSLEVRATPQYYVFESRSEAKIIHLLKRGAGRALSHSVKMARWSRKARAPFRMTPTKSSTEDFRDSAFVKQLVSQLPRGLLVTPVAVAAFATALRDFEVTICDLKRVTA